MADALLAPCSAAGAAATLLRGSSPGGPTAAALRLMSLHAQLMLQLPRRDAARAAAAASLSLPACLALLDAAALSCDGRAPSAAAAVPPALRAAFMQCALAASHPTGVGAVVFSSQKTLAGTYGSAEEPAGAYTVESTDSSSALQLNVPEEFELRCLKRGASLAEEPGGKRARNAPAPDAADDGDELRNAASAEDIVDDAAPAGDDDALQAVAATPSSGGASALSDARAYAADVSAQLVASQQMHAAALRQLQQQRHLLEQQHLQQLAEQARVLSDARASADAATARADAAEAEQARLQHAQRDSARSLRSAAAVAAQAQQTVAVMLERVQGAEAAAAAATVSATAAEHALEEAHEAAVCSICMDAARDTLAFACGHMHCAGCGAAMARCPLCNSRKRRTAQRVYL